MKIKLCTCDPTHYAELLHGFDHLGFEKKEGVNAIPLCEKCRDNIAYNKLHWKPGTGNRLHFRLYMLYWYHLINAFLIVSEKTFNAYKSIRRRIPGK